MTEIKNQQPAGICRRPTVITLIGPPRGPGARPREITLLTGTSYSQLQVATCVDPLQGHVSTPDSSVLVSSKRIPRPPNAFMIFANDWRKRLAVQHPAESNKSISVRLGQLWKNMSKHSKEIYYQRSRQAGQDHKQKYPGYVYNPKEARLRKALREQSRGLRYSGGAPARWTKSLIMNHHRQSLISPVVLPHQQLCVNSSKMLHEQMDRDSGLLHSYPNYLDLPYNIPSSDYQSDSQTWYPYIQSGVDSNGVGPYMDRVSENKLPVDWSTPYSSEQGNFIRASPQSSPYSLQSHQEVLPNSLLMNGDGVHSDQTTPDQKPAVDQLLSQNNDNKDPEQQVKELLASAQVISEDSASQEESIGNGNGNGNGTRLPGFHQAFGSTEIGRFSQPDGFFEAAVAAENERKSPQVAELPGLSFSPTWNPSYFSFPDCAKQEPDLFGFQEQDDCYAGLSADSHFYATEQKLLEVSQIKSELEPQDLSVVGSISQPPVIISQNNNCCVVLEPRSPATADDVKQYYSL